MVHSVGLIGEKDIKINFLSFYAGSAYIRACNEKEAAMRKHNAIQYMMYVFSFPTEMLLSGCELTANALSVQTYVNQPVKIQLTGTDRDGDALTVKIVTPPNRGVISGTPPEIVYTPVPDYIGPDQSHGPSAACWI